VAQADSQLAGEVKALLARGDRAKACERFEELVAHHQRRASRIAYYYLRNAAEVDEAVQDAFLKAFVHLPSFREELLFELWFTTILVNGCLDRIKARKRRARWIVSTSSAFGSHSGNSANSTNDERDLIERRPAREPSPEASLLADERSRRLRQAVDTLPDRQRSVVVLNQFEGHSTREVSQLLGLNEATVRVHLFRAIRSLRKQLSDELWLAGRSAPAHEAI
jgi:RNA polymerase sigma-70 factor (ECF subfamily)